MINWSQNKLSKNKVAIELINNYLIDNDNEDSGNKERSDQEHNQGILSNIEESGGIDIDVSKSKDEKNKDNIFESQISVIQCNEDPKEISTMDRVFESLDLDKSRNAVNDSIFDKLNDSLIKNREVIKDKNQKRESFRLLVGAEKKKISESFLKEDSISKNEQNTSENIKDRDSLGEDSKILFDKRVHSFNQREQFQNQLEVIEETENLFEPEMPSEDFFCEKESESIIERNDEDSKFVDEEFSSVAYLTKQQLYNNLKGSVKNTNIEKIEGNIDFSKIFYPLVFLII